MTPYGKPLPVRDERNRPFWEGARRGELCLQRCVGCHAFRLPASRYCPGCGGDGSEWDNIATGFAGDQWHELAHVYGLDHAPSDRCNPDPAPDDVDRDFTPPDGSLGGVGVDPANRLAFPSSTFDFMAYCGPSWVSAYHWVKLFNRFQGNG